MGLCQAKVCFLLAGRAEGGEGLPSPFLLLPAPSKWRGGVLSPSPS